MLLGIFLAVSTGLSWVVTGACVGLVERCGRSAGQLMAARSSFLLVFSAVLVGVGRALWPESPFFTLCLAWRPALLMAAWGGLSYVMSVFMGRAMARGPNGAAWTIVQSGFVFPFTMGIALGNTAATQLRIAGLVLILMGVVFGGMAKSASAGAKAERGGSASGNGAFGTAWLVPALLGFFFCGMNQCAVNLVSFLPPEARPAQPERVAWGALGMLAVAALHGLLVLAQRVACGAKAETLASAGRRAAKVEGEARRAPLSFLVKIAAAESIVVLLSGLFLLYNALDILQSAGRAAIASPIMVASCLVGFLVYGAIALRERPNRFQTMGILCSLGGITLLAL